MADDTMTKDGFVLPFYVLLAVALAVAVYTFADFQAAAVIAGGFAVIGLLVFSPLGLPVAAVIDAVNIRIGRIVAWLIVVAIFVSAVNAVVRKSFDMSSNAWLELQWVLFGAVFLLCAPWTLISNEHIRIDVANSLFSRRGRNYIELIGHLLFLLPFAYISLITSIPFALSSYRINEQSLNAGGLPQWPAKILVPLGFAILFVQGISELAKRIAVMQGRIPDPGIGGAPHAPLPLGTDDAPAIQTADNAR